MGVLCNIGRSEQSSTGGSLLSVATEYLALLGAESCQSCLGICRPWMDCRPVSEVCAIVAGYCDAQAFQGATSKQHCVGFRRAAWRRRRVSAAVDSGSVYTETRGPIDVLAAKK